MTEKNESLGMMAMVAEITASYVANNDVAASDLPALIQDIYRNLCNVNSGHSFLLSERSEPAVAIEDSVQPDYIVCLEDGRRLKMLKRHLKTAYNMTPDQYRARWKLPTDYPMVAPNYAKRRSALAKDIGLGTYRERRREVAA